MYLPTIARFIIKVAGHPGNKAFILNEVDSIKGHKDGRVKKGQQTDGHENRRQLERAVKQI